jgi:hypothetical protein
LFRVAFATNQFHWLAGPSARDRRGGA